MSAEREHFLDGRKTNSSLLVARSYELGTFPSRNKIFQIRFNPIIMSNELKGGHYFKTRNGGKFNPFVFAAIILH